MSWFELICWVLSRAALVAALVMWAVISWIRQMPDEDWNHE